MKVRVREAKDDIEKSYGKYFSEYFFKSKRGSEWVATHYNLNSITQNAFDTYDEAYNECIRFAESHGEKAEFDNKKIGVFPGTFDPFTLGHKSVVEKALDLFDEIHIVIGVNPSKKCMFSPEIREQIIKENFLFRDNIKVVFWEGLMVDYCKKVGAKYMIRGIRSGMDFDYENSIKYAEKKINQEVETIYFITDSEYAGVSSSIVRELIKNKHYEDLYKFVYTTVNIGVFMDENKS